MAEPRALQVRKRKAAKFAVDDRMRRQPAAWLTLHDDVWAAVAEHLGLDAYRLRRACKSTQRALSTDKALPLATRLAFETLTEKNRGTYTITTAQFYDRRYEMIPLPTLLDALYLIDTQTFQMTYHYPLRLATTARCCPLYRCACLDTDGEPLAEDKVVRAMRTAAALGMCQFTTWVKMEGRTVSGVRMPKGALASVFLLAANRGMAKVCRLMPSFGFCTPNMTDLACNNALAYARLGHDEMVKDLGGTDRAKAAAKAKYADVFALFTNGHWSLTDAPWRDPDRFGYPEASWPWGGVVSH